MIAASVARSAASTFPGKSVRIACGSAISSNLCHYKYQEPSAAAASATSLQLLSRPYSSTIQLSKKAKKKEDGEKDAETAAKLSYFDRKTALKQERVQTYQHKLQRLMAKQHRRNSAPKDILKNDFISWWQGRQIYEEKMERHAKQAGLEWKLQVATIVERLPVVLKDKQDFETAFEDLQAQVMSQRGKAYPVEFVGTSGQNRPVALTDDELMGRYNIQSHFFG